VLVQEIRTTLNAEDLQSSQKLQLRDNLEQACSLRWTEEARWTCHWRCKRTCRSKWRCNSL